MKKFLSLATIIIVACSSSDAQILWKISGNGLKSPSYIFGTHHIAPLSTLEDIKGFEKAFNAVDGVCGELVMSEMQQPAGMMELQKAMMLPAGHTLQSFYSEEEFGRISACFKKLAGTDISIMNPVKPVVISQQLTLIMSMMHIKGYNPDEQLDSYLQECAVKAGKKVTSLETIQQQIDLLFNVPLEEQAEDLLYLVDHEEESMEEAKELAEAYKEQDLDDLLELMEEEEDDGDGCELEDVLYKRNAAWVEKIPGMMSEGPVMFVVGAGHLPGERGVLNGLKAKGFRLTPVK